MLLLLENYLSYPYHGLSLISFLCQRKIFVKLNHMFSQSRCINRSIVQESEVGPIFYILHESDLHLLSFINLLLNYTDDTNLLVPEYTNISSLKCLRMLKNGQGTIKWLSTTVRLKS
jgi:hypothetical protein